MGAAHLDAPAAQLAALGTVRHVGTAILTAPAPVLYATDAEALPATRARRLTHAEALPATLTVRVLNPIWLSAQPLNPATLTLD